jgi:hypothetical protein
LRAAFWTNSVREDCTSSSPAMRLRAGLRELVRGVVGQHALGEYDFRVVEIAPFVAEATSSEVIFLPHVVLETEIVARSSVTVSLPEGERQPSVNVSVTPLDEVQERLTEKQVGKLWTADELAEAYRTLPDQRLSQRLLRLLRWAVDRNCLITRGRPIQSSDSEALPESA